MAGRADLRDAARRALLGTTPAGVDGGAEVVRATIDVRIGDAVEMVSLALREGGIAASCSCGQPACPHVREAMRVLAGDGGGVIRVDAGPSADDFPTGGGRISVVPGGSRAPTSLAPRADEASWRTVLAGALDDLVTAVVRVGAAAADAPSIEESLGRVTRALPTPMPLGAARWVGRLRTCLGGAHIAGAARLLDEAAHLADDLRAGPSSGESVQRLGAFLGAGALGLDGAIERIHNRTYVDIGREVVAGLERAAIERRYLLDPERGEVLCEERLRASGTPFIGPCPCMLEVGFGEIEPGPAPRRMRPLQYAVSNVVPATVWSEIAGAASRSFPAVADSYRAALRTFPGLAEPFAIVAPASHARDGGLTIADAQGRPLPIARAEDPSTSLALDGMIETLGAPAWIAGRLIDAKGVLLLFPISAAFPADGATVFRRIT